MSAFKGFSDNQLRKGENEEDVNFRKGIFNYSILSENFPMTLENIYLDRQSPAKKNALKKAKPLFKSKNTSLNNENLINNDDLPPEALLSSQPSTSSATEIETLKSPNKSATTNQSGILLYTLHLLQFFVLILFDY